MAHIDLKNNLPGIRGLLAYNVDTAKPMSEFVEVLLRNDQSTLSRGERELIASYVSYLNNCFYCEKVHGAIAQYYLQCDVEYFEKIKADLSLSELPPKLSALLTIASQVQKSGKAVTLQHIEVAKQKGASDMEIHDTVLIAAAFCMFNRYVDGLGTTAPTDMQFYTTRAERRANEGYIDFDLYR